MIDHSKRQSSRNEKVVSVFVMRRKQILLVDAGKTWEPLLLVEVLLLLKLLLLLDRQLLLLQSPYVLLVKGRVGAAMHQATFDSSNIAIKCQAISEDFS